MSKVKLIPPYGGKLVNLLVTGKEKDELTRRLPDLPSIKINQRALNDLELLATGGFSPLDRYMDKSTYDRVLNEMRMDGGILWPLPITLTVNPKDLPSVGNEIVIRNALNDPLAIMKLEEIFSWDAEKEARLAYGSNDARHPMVSEMGSWGKVCISGELKVISLPKYHDFVEIRCTPSDVRKILEAKGHENVVAFQTRNPLHRIHDELTKSAAAKVGSSLLIHPVVGLTKPGELEN